MTYWRVWSVPLGPRGGQPAVGVGCLGPLTVDEWDRFIERLQVLKPEFLGEADLVINWAAVDRAARIRKLANDDWEYQNSIRTPRGQP